MKTKLLILLLGIQGIMSFSFAQDNEQDNPFERRHKYYNRSATQEIKEAISKEFNTWLQKSEFESTSDYQKRINNESSNKLKSITDKTILEIKKNHLNVIPLELGSYDADNEIYIGKAFQQKNDIYNIRIPRNIAPEFKNARLCVYPIETNIINDKWIVTKAYIILGIGRDWRWSDYGIGNFWIKNDRLFGVSEDSSIPKEYAPEIIDISQYPKKSWVKDKRFAQDDMYMNSYEKNWAYYYKWNIEDQANYSPKDIKPVSLTLEDLNVTLPTINTNSTSDKDTKTKEPELDITKIQTQNQNPNAIAVVIGNRDYTETKHVNYAIDDAQTVRNYLSKVMGYSDGNILYYENATKSKFETLFGTKDEPQGKLSNIIKPGVSDVFIYYSGHGAPSVKNNKGYFVPVDCDPQYVEQGGYSLDLFYANIAKLNAKSITVVTDACFSGAELLKDISPITITISNPVAVASNCVVLSSSAGSQVSSWYNEKKHGLFTYFFLRAMQDKEKCDANKDNKLTFKEIFDYISDKTSGVPAFARSLSNVEQTPTIQGAGAENVLIEYK